MTPYEQALLEWALEGHKFIGVRDDWDTLKDIEAWEARMPTPLTQEDKLLDARIGLIP